LISNVISEHGLSNHGIHYEINGPRTEETPGDDDGILDSDEEEGNDLTEGGGQEQADARWKVPKTESRIKDSYDLAGLE
jgi:hypothetical protein